MSYPGSGAKDEPWHAYAITIRNGRVRVTIHGPGLPLIGPLSWILATAHSYACEIRSTPPEMRRIEGPLLSLCGEAEWTKRRGRLRGVRRER